MPLYYFDIQLGGQLHRDSYGDAFDTVQEAAAQAQALVLDIARDYPPGEDGTTACEVRDDQGRVQYRAELTFKGESIAGSSVGSARRL